MVTKFKAGFSQTIGSRSFTASLVRFQNGNQKKHTMLKIIAIISFYLLFRLAPPATAAEILTLSTNRVACTNIKDWIDLLSMKGRSDAVMPVLMDKINNGGCKRLYKGTELRIEQHEDRKLADGSNLPLACATRVDISDPTCFWILDITAMIEQQ